MANIDELLERVRAATGPDREIDADLCRALDKAAWAKYRNWAGMPCGAPEHILERDASGWADKYTSSVDASLALAERNLPSHYVTMGQNVHHRYWLCTFTHLNDEGAPVSNMSEMLTSSLPLAILAALLSALANAD